MNKKKKIRKAFLFVVVFIAVFSIIGLSVIAEEIMPSRPSLAVGSQSSGQSTDDEIAPERPRIAAFPAAEEDGEEPDEYLAEEEPADPDVEPDEELSFEDEILLSIDHSKDALAAINGMTNILLIGLDARPNEKTGRSDTMILLTLDAENGSIKMTSFMRDLYVEIPGHKNNRLNSAYVYGGARLLIETLEKNFGVQVDHYVAVNFSTLASVIDQIGGLTVDVDQKYVKRINAVIKQDNIVLKLNKNDGLLESGGEQKLTGKQAQAYARYRYGTGDGDFGRTARQREVIMKAIGKIKNLSMASLIKLAVNNIDKIETDMDITEMVNLAPALFKLADTEIRELRIPVDKGYTSKTISGMAVLVPDRSKSLKAITEFLND